MSIAASLANLRREGKAIPHNPAKVELTKLSLKSSLAERAASARNALNLLSTADPSLPSFEHRLHLTETSFDRAVLPPDAQKALSTAVTSLTLRLTPVFLTRPCTAILEWLLQTLQLSILGSTEEIDSIFLCALPYHQTEQFLLVSRAILTSPNARKWRWLVKKVKQGHLVDTSFCVENAPLQVFKRIISRAVECVKQGVAVSPLAALVTNFVARRMASDDCPVLAVICVEAIISVRGEGAAAENLICALLVALAAAISHGLELSVAQTVASVAAQFLPRIDISSDITQTSAALLALCLRTHANSLSSKEARMLLKADNLSTVLSCLGREQSIDTYREIITRAVASGNISEKHLRLVAKALEAEHLLSSDSISVLIKAILESSTIESGAGGAKFAEDRAALLASLLTMLFNSSFSSTLDDVLHQHFTTRSVEKRDKKNFRVIDTAVCKAMDSIMSGNLKSETSDGVYPLSVDILCLSHPDRKKRRRALESISRRDLSKCNNENELKRLVERLKSIIEFERDLNLVASAMESVMRVPTQLISMAVIGAALVRCSSKPEQETEQSGEKEKLADSLLELCDKASDEQRLLVCAVLLLLSFEGLLDGCCRSEAGQKRMKLLCKRFGISKENQREGVNRGIWDVNTEVRELVGQMILEETNAFSDFFSTIAETRETWIGRLSQMWMKILLSHYLRSKSNENSNLTLLRILRLIKLHPKVSEELFALIETDFNLIVRGAKSELDGVVLLWRVTSQLSDWQYHERVLKSLTSDVGLALILKVLKIACVDEATSIDARKRSLEWYINLCIVHPDIAVWKDAIETIARIAYGDDSRMRMALDNIWKRRSTLNRKKRERKSTLWDFLQLLSSLQERVSQADPPDSVTRLLRTEIFEAASNSGLLQLGTKPPLRYASFDTSKTKDFETHLGAKLLDLREICAEDLYLLRALGEGYFANCNEHGKMYTLLGSTLELLKKQDHPQSDIEALCRISLMTIVSGRTPTAPQSEIRKVAKSLAGAFNIVIAPAPDPPDPTLVIILLCLIGHMISLTEPKRSAEKDSLAELLLSSIVSPTTAGPCASRIIGSMAGEGVRQEYLLILLRNLVPGRGAKARKSPASLLAAWDDKEASSSAKAGLGAVKAINQHIGKATKKEEKLDISWLRSSLSVLWKFLQSLHKEDPDVLVNAESHSLEQMVILLRTITSLQRAISQHGAQKSQEAAREADFDALIGVAFAQQEADTIANPIMQEVQNAAYELVGVLMSCQVSGTVRILPKLLNSRTFAGQVALIVKLLEEIVPTVITTENEAQDIIKVIGQVAYDESSQISEADRMKMMQTLLMTRDDFVKAFAVTKLCLKEIYQQEHRTSSSSASIRHCSEFLKHANLTCAEDIDCMTFMESEVDGRITSIHFVNPEFLAKLGSFTENDLPMISTIDEKLSKLFVALLQLKPGAEKDLAVHLVLAGVPLSAMEVCSLAAMEATSIRSRIDALRYVGERLGTESIPLLPTWLSMSDESIISPKARREVESRFLVSVGGKICDFVVKTGTTPGEIETREVATDALASLAQRFGSASYTAIQEFGARISGLSTNDSDIIQSLSDLPGKGLLLRGKVLECLATFTSRLAKYSLPFVPHLLESSLVVLEEFCDSKRRNPPEPQDKDYNASVFVTTASVKALTAVLTSCPMFLGGKSLKRLISLALRTEVETPCRLLQHAAREVPVEVFVAAFVSVATIDNQELRDAHVAGLLGLVQGVSSGVSRLYKSEIKANWLKLLNVLLQSLDSCRDASMLIGEKIPPTSRTDVLDSAVREPSSEPQFEEKGDSLKDCDQLDIACAEVLIMIVLKLSESEFESVFKSLLQWFDSGSLPDAAITACEDQGKEVEKNVLRGLPFFAMIGKLLSVLKSIMIPFFIRLLSRITAIIGRKITMPCQADENSARAKKRSRASMQVGGVCSVLVSQQAALRETCLELLGSFFSFELKESMMTARLIGDLQAALLSAFDELHGESKSVSKALQGLAKRMMFPGITNDTKKNQDMLIGLVRDVLSRTRDPSARLRAGALNTCREMASAVGDELLTTLPESMPILAEVIDDEEASVAKSATRYVLFLESLAGEPILQQLK